MDKIEISVDVITGIVTEIKRPFTEEELAASAAEYAAQQAQQAQQEAQETAKASALDKLTALGLTTDEITALLGTV